MKSLRLNMIMMSAVLALTLPVHAALAQSDLLNAGKNMVNNSSDSSAGGAMGALGGMANGNSNSLGSMAGGLSLDKIKGIIEKQGYSNISGLKPSASGNTLQAAATNSSGSPVDLLINPTSGKVLSALTK